MADEKWQKVRETFDSALRRKPEERQKFVLGLCGTDKTLLAEVESLLSSLDSAENFMETPAVARVADVFETETKKLETGNVSDITKSSSKSVWAEWAKFISPKTKNSTEKLPSKFSTKDLVRTNQTSTDSFRKLNPHRL